MKTTTKLSKEAEQLVRTFIAGMPRSRLEAALITTMTRCNLLSDIVQLAYLHQLGKLSSEKQKQLGSLLARYGTN